MGKLQKNNMNTSLTIKEKIGLKNLAKQIKPATTEEKNDLVRRGTMLIDSFRKMGNS